MQPIDGFWLPRSIREQVLNSGTEYVTRSFAQGRPCAAGDEGAVTARWPVLGAVGWQQLLALLAENRAGAPRGQDYWNRFSAAVQAAASRFADSQDPLHRLALASLPGYTGYSPPMIRSMLSALDLRSPKGGSAATASAPVPKDGVRGKAVWALDLFPAALQLEPTWQTAAAWQRMGVLPGRLRFYPARRSDRVGAWLPGRASRPLFGPLLTPDLVVGYGAGNVPGTALLIAFLAQAVTLAGGAPPAVLVKNSRREPILAPLMLDAMEEFDADLVSTLAVMIWEYEDLAVQPRGEAVLAIAAASDETIAQIEASLNRFAPAGAVRFHAHGHKVSFSAIGREVLARGQRIEPEGIAWIDVVSLLAALDSVYWDQHGCLSSRVHFVEEGGPDCHTPLEYAEHLAGQLALLGSFLPRGAWPRQQLHDRFDRYKLLEQTSQVRVLSDYDDPFVLIYDARPLGEGMGFRLAVNDCMGRVVIVRPVSDLLEVPERYLRLLPTANLQSLSVAVGRPDQGLSEGFIKFATACGARGVTAIRTAGRGAFPQLAYSWDGLLPLDLVRQRSPGWFTTVEFDTPYDDMLATYRLMMGRGATSSPEV